MEELENEGELEAIKLPKVVKEKVETLKQILSGRNSESQAFGSGRIPKFAREYEMAHGRRGKALIFNLINFPSLLKRNGAETDSENLEKTLSAVGFDVDLHVDKKKQGIESILGDVQKEDHSDADCLLVVMMTHGDEEGFLYDSSSWKFSPSKLWTPFTSDLCPSLAGKPKIFLVQACQGDRLDGVVKMSNRRCGELSSYELPNHVDFLIATSTISGKASLRNTLTGSYFISAVCKVLEEEANKEEEEANYSQDLLSILTEVARRVATEKPQVWETKIEFQ